MPSYHALKPYDQQLPLLPAARICDLHLLKPIDDVRHAFKEKYLILMRVQRIFTRIQTEIVLANLVLNRNFEKDWRLSRRASSECVTDG